MNPDMTPSLILVLVCAVVISAGIYLLLERSLTRILIGVLLASNGVNMLFLVASGRAGTPPFVGEGRDPAEMADPLPQALVLTAIVITLGTMAFVLTLAYRSFQLNGNDEVADDIEDAQIRELAELDRASQSFDEHDDSSVPSEDDRLIISEDERPTGPSSTSDSDVSDSDVAREARDIEREERDSEELDTTDLAEQRLDPGDVDSFIIGEDNDEPESDHDDQREEDR